MGAKSKRHPYRWQNCGCGCVSPFRVRARRVVAGAGDAVPGAVRVPSEAAVGTGAAVHVAVVESDLCHGRRGSDVQLLLQRADRDTSMFSQPPVRALPQATRCSRWVRSHSCLGFSSTSSTFTDSNARAPELSG